MAINEYTWKNITEIHRLREKLRQGDVLDESEVYVLRMLSKIEQEPEQRQSLELEIEAFQELNGDPFRRWLKKEIEKNIPQKRF